MGGSSAKWKIHPRGSLENLYKVMVDEKNNIDCPIGFFKTRHNVKIQELICVSCFIILPLVIFWQILACVVVLFFETHFPRIYADIYLWIIFMMLEALLVLIIIGIVKRRFWFTLTIYRDRLVFGTGIRKHTMMTDDVREITDSCGCVIIKSNSATRTGYYEQLDDCFSLLLQTCKNSVIVDAQKQEYYLLDSGDSKKALKNAVKRMRWQGLCILFVSGICSLGCAMALFVLIRQEGNLLKNLFFFILLVIGSMSWSEGVDCLRDSVRISKELRNSINAKIE